MRTVLIPVGAIQARDQLCDHLQRLDVMLVFQIALVSVAIRVDRQLVEFVLELFLLLLELLDPPVPLLHFDLRQLPRDIVVFNVPLHRPRLLSEFFDFVLEGLDGRALTLPLPQYQEFLFLIPKHHLILCVLALDDLLLDFLILVPQPISPVLQPVRHLYSNRWNSLAILIRTDGGSLWHRRAPLNLGTLWEVL